MKLQESTQDFWGNNALIGREVDGRMQKSFAFRELDAATEANIERARARKGGPGKHEGKLVTEILCRTLTEWCGDAEFGNKPPKEQARILRDSYANDVLYAFVCLRIETMTPDFALTLECGECGKKFDWATDLTGLELTVSGETPLPPQVVKLRRPIPLGDDRQVTEVQLGIAKWSSITNVNVKNGLSIGNVKDAILMGSIEHLIDNKGVVIAKASALLAKMHKLDRERMIKFMRDEDSVPAADMTFHCECTHDGCGHVHKTELDWTWDFFFGAASLPAE